MNWEAIGAVGEIVGALAVVGTLAYLALQIRASIKETEANHWAVTGSDHADVLSRFMEYADVWTKGNEGEELTKSERFVFRQLFELKNNHHFFAFGRRVMLGTGAGVFESVHVTAMADFLHRHPAAYALWRAGAVEGGQITESVGALWVRQVSEAAAALEATETAPAA